jgi:tetratricopeptide (TPR) repeat protein
MSTRTTNSILLIILAAGLGLSVLTAATAYRANGANGFPLDDPWIHLQFAKNVHDYGVFSYYRDEMVTSGSTAPLYTLLLAVGFFFTSNEMLLSYVLGVAFYLAGAVIFYRLSGRLLGSAGILPLGATAVFILDPRLHWAALSGMETTLFIFLLLAATLFYLEGWPWRFGASAGLLLWVRPEAVLFYAALLVHWVYHRWWAQDGGRAEVVQKSQAVPVWKFLPVVALCGAAYMLFNLHLSDSVLPNTYTAKLTYYAAGGENFPAQAFRYLSSGHQLLLVPLVAGTLVLLLVRIARRRSADWILPILWILALTGAYWWKLPYLYQNGRYLMPAIPFLVLIAFWGIRELAVFVQNRSGEWYREMAGIALPTLLAVIIGTQTLLAGWQERLLYADHCGYILNRQVQGARWIRANLPDDALIATHDIGAIGFYSGRRVVDMVGLVSPEAVKSIGNREALMQMLTDQKVTHVAVLRSWFEIVNVNPLFQTDERFPETLEIFAFQPDRMYLTGSRAAYLTEVARAALMGGDISTAGQILADVVVLEPRSSRAHYLYAWALLLYDYRDQAEREVEEALRLHPEYWDARNLQVEIALNGSEFDRAEELLKDLLNRNPSYAQAYRTLSDLYRTVRGDSAAAASYLRQYEQLVKRSGGRERQPGP